MIEIQIINILSLFWKHNTFLAVYCTLLTVISVYISKQKQKTKQNKTAKQISKQKNKTKKKQKKEEGKKKVVSRIGTRCLRVNPTSHSHYAIEGDHMHTRKVLNLMRFPWNLRRQTIEP